MTSNTTDERLSVDAFLSHRYKSPEVNLFFYDLLAEQTEVQFGVDKGTFSTNVTRLERMIRDADAFIGIYPFPGEPAETPRREDLLRASPYFRLELDIAVRARKPMLVFYDQRYGDVLMLPESAYAVPFNAQEFGGKTKPREATYRRAIEDYRRLVQASIAQRVEQNATVKPGRVGLLVPMEGDDAYTSKDIDVMQNAARAAEGSELVLPPKPFALTGAMQGWIDSLDWIIADVGERMMNTGLIGYLHGRAMPTVRLYRGARAVADVETRDSYRHLYGVHQVGYPKDIVFWQAHEQLAAELTERMCAVRREPMRSGAGTAAVAYFRGAALRNEVVFLSYSGKDQAMANPISQALKARFQEVFDYRDGASITPGQPWIQEIFDKLARSALAIPLISQDYLDSRNCMHEAQEITAHQDSGHLVVIPIKLKMDEVQSPSWMRNTQYLRLWEYPDTDTAVAKLIEGFDQALELRKAKQEDAVGKNG